MCVLTYFFSSPLHTPLPPRRLLASPPVPQRCQIVLPYAAPPPAAVLIFTTSTATAATTTSSSSTAAAATAGRQWEYQSVVRRRRRRRHAARLAAVLGNAVVIVSRTRIHCRLSFSLSLARSVRPSICLSLRTTTRIGLEFYFSYSQTRRGEAKTEEESTRCAWTNQRYRGGEIEWKHICAYAKCVHKYLEYK